MEPFNLDNAKLKSGFVSPEGYFESLEQKVLLQTVEKRPKVFSLTRSKIWFSGIAASLALFFFVTKSSSPTDFDAIDTTAMESYLATEFSMYELTDKLETEDIDNLNELATLQTTALEDYFEDSQNIEYYLNE